MNRFRDDPDSLYLRHYQPYYHVVEQTSGSEVVSNGRKMVMMCSNEYLGLSQHPLVVESATQALKTWGTSPCGSRLANGTRSYHIELEEELADFLGTEACHVTSAGYLACMASISTLVHHGDSLFVDKSIHSSLVDGSLLSRAHLRRFRHENLPELEQMLAAAPPSRAKAIVVDGVYSIEGHIASLPHITRLGNLFQALVIVDDAHGLGVLGHEGRGTVNHYGLGAEVDVQVGSFSKSLASTGGFIAASRDTISYLRTHCRQIIFSAALPPAQSAAALTSLRILRSEPGHLAKMKDNCHYYRQGLESLGIDFWQSATAGFPIVIGSRERCYRVWHSLWEQGFFTVMVTSPGVAAGRDLIRTAMTAQHSRDQIDRFLAALARALETVRDAEPAATAEPAQIPG
ncbi:MAG: aminotransferase class I/II-fold pyridoxal phosphate-dependent enzyme [Candidatus Methylacidiphilales bacterium]|nr:aminotransferase class I/II-fold pyridoxal phosphate-dependent enzyme [Candidatus Methylacidiphilales bacterium]